MIQKIYKSLGKYEFISLTKYFTDEQKDEVFLKILEEDEDYYQENYETEKKEKFRNTRSRSVANRNNTNKNNNKEKQLLKMFLKKKVEKKPTLKRNGLSAERFDRKKKEIDINNEKNNKTKLLNRSINYREIKDKNNLPLQEVSILSIDANNNDKNKRDEKNLKKTNEKENKKQYIKMRSQVLDKKIITKIKTNNNQTNSNNNKIKNNNDKNNSNEDRISIAISSEQLNSLLLSVNESALKENIKIKTQLINKMHDVIYKEFSKNKKTILDNSNNIISTFVTTTKKYLVIISKEIIPLKHLTNTFSLICTLKEILYYISYDVEKNLMELIFIIYSLKDITSMGKNKEGISILKNYNSIMQRTIDYCPPINTIKILFDKIIIFRNNNKPNFLEYSIKSLNKLANNIKIMCDKIKVSEILFRVNAFLLEYSKIPPKLQHKNNDNVVLQTVKELVCQLVEVRKDKIIDDYNRYMKIKNKDGEDVLHDKNIKIWINDVIRTLDSDYLIK